MENAYKFQKLTPIQDVDLSIYKEALDFVFANEDIKNIGVSGAYCAGKSSVIESYKKLCLDLSRKVQSANTQMNFLEPAWSVAEQRFQKISPC
jgi:hypothetical protein